MSAITGITLPTAIDWDQAKYKGAATDHISKLDTIMQTTTTYKGESVTYLDLYLGALVEVAIETLNPGRQQIAAYVIEHYSTDGIDSVKSLFTDWLTFTPAPAPAENPTNINPQNGGPGFFIECWDYIVNTVAGITLANADEFRPWFTNFLNYHGDWINSKQSTGTLKAWINYHGSTAHPFDIKDFHRPDKNNTKTAGFTSFNQFFLRNVQQETPPTPLQRPLCSNPDSIVAPCDGGIFYLYEGDNASGGDTKQDFTLPGKSDDPFNIKHALPSQYSEQFVGGQLLDILLWFTDYHHFHSPVDGKVVDHGLDPGSYNYDFDAFDENHPLGKIPADEGDRAGWYQKLAKHQRYYWIIETEKFGTVAMIAIGFWGVGSIINGLSDSDNTGSGIPVTRGQYMGHFGYGGSSIVLAFEKDKKFNFSVGGKHPVQGPENPTLMKVRECLGTKA